ncbi:hypothetical protein [Aurantimonas coralicida]|uniref:hypothetical protein n=1 Tax=Aurantimonas coralicida TaxID=182270 RepID=UPI001E37C140|nr:hypothetical protein [Aurantimonas coralicida]MCD1645283.1 hypothetical protein [Aurantimonas coralicida]
MDDESDQDWMTIGEAVDAVLAELGMGAGTTEREDAVPAIRDREEVVANGDEVAADRPTCRVLLFMPRAHSRIPRMAEDGDHAGNPAAEDARDHQSAKDRHAAALASCRRRIRSDGSSVSQAAEHSRQDGIR